jgi:hypothetical protein
MAAMVDKVDESVALSLWFWWVAVREFYRKSAAA